MCFLILAQLACINATESNDPDIDPGLDMRLNFEWFCRRASNRDRTKSEVFDFDNPNLIYYPPEPKQAALNYSSVDQEEKNDFKGCFGTDHGLLSESGKFVSN